MRFLALLAFVLLTLTSNMAFAAPLQVVASISILGDLVKQVGGEYVDVTTLVGPDGDAHVFQPTPADGKKIANASVVFMNGLGLEGWMERLMTATDYKGRVVVVSKEIPAPLTMTETDDHTHGMNMTDPHAWQNIANGRIYVKNIAAALIAADGEHRAFYIEKANALDKELVTLDAWVKSEIAKIPTSKRKVISSHDAFQYLAKAYDIEFLAPVGMSTQAEPSAKDVQALIEQIKHNGIKSIFLENMANTKLISQIAEEAHVNVGPVLYADALSLTSGPAASYQQMFTYNISKLVEAMRSNK